MKTLCTIFTCMSLISTTGAQIIHTDNAAHPDQTLKPISVASNDRIAVISGGGAYGAWGAGLSERLYNIRLNNRKQFGDNPSVCKNCGDYRIVIGTSTGSLMAPLILVNRYADLREGIRKLRRMISSM